MNRPGNAGGSRPWKRGWSHAEGTVARESDDAEIHPGGKGERGADGASPAAGVLNPPLSCHKRPQNAVFGYGSPRTVNRDDLLVRNTFTNANRLRSLLGICQKVGGSNPFGLNLPRPLFGAGPSGPVRPNLSRVDHRFNDNADHRLCTQLRHSSAFPTPIGLPTPSARSWQCGLQGHLPVAGYGTGSSQLRV